LNPPGDSARTDGPGTLIKAAEVHARAMTLIDEEAEKLRKEGAVAILCDATPVPLIAAHRAGIPGFLLANFTWADIYLPHARKLGDDARQTVREIRSAYRHASLLFRAEPALKMDWMPRTMEVGMVVTPGVDRRMELRTKLGISAAEKLVYFYIGRYGQANLGWSRLGQLKGVHFVGFHAAPLGPLANLHVIDPTEWTGADLAASSDAIVAKAGYGTVCEAMVAQVPFIYPPRTSFAEHRVLDRALRTWGGGIPVSSRDFASLKLEKPLEKAFTLRPGPSPFPSDGASKVAGHLIETWKPMS
jgi:hypothetical protein